MNTTSVNLASLISSVDSSLPRFDSSQIKTSKTDINKEKQDALDEIKRTKQDVLDEIEHTKQDIFEKMAHARKAFLQETDHTKQSFFEQTELKSKTALEDIERTKQESIQDIGRIHADIDTFVHTFTTQTKQSLTELEQKGQKVCFDIEQAHSLAAKDLAHLRRQSADRLYEIVSKQQQDIQTLSQKQLIQQQQSLEQTYQTLLQKATSSQKALQEIIDEANKSLYEIKDVQQTLFASQKTIEQTLQVSATEASSIANSIRALSDAQSHAQDFFYETCNEALADIQALQDKADQTKLEAQEYLIKVLEQAKALEDKQIQICLDIERAHTKALESFEAKTKQLSKQGFFKTLFSRSKKDKEILVIPMGNTSPIPDTQDIPASSFFETDTEQDQQKTLEEKTKTVPAHAQSKEKKPHPRAYLVIGGVVLVIAFVVIACVLFFQTKETTQTIQPQTPQISTENDYSLQEQAEVFPTQTIYTYRIEQSEEHGAACVEESVLFDEAGLCSEANLCLEFENEQEASVLFERAAEVYAEKLLEASQEQNKVYIHVDVSQMGLDRYGYEQALVLSGVSEIEVEERY